MTHQLLLGAEQFGQCLAAAPPRIPAERLKIWHEAYDCALKDADLLEEVKRQTGAPSTSVAKNCKF